MRLRTNELGPDEILGLEDDSHGLEPNLNISQNKNDDITEDRVWQGMPTEFVFCFDSIIQNHAGVLQFKPGGDGHVKADPMKVKIVDKAPALQVKGRKYALEQLKFLHKESSTWKN